jgi:hypothetical protein
MQMKNRQKRLYLAHSVASVRCEHRGQRRPQLNDALKHDEYTVPTRLDVLLKLAGQKCRRRAFRS